MLRAAFLASTACAAALPAQGTTYISSLRTLFEVRATKVPQLLEQWRGSALGGLFEDPEARRCGRLAARFEGSRIHRRTETWLAMHQLGSDQEAPPAVIASLYRMGQGEVWRMLERPVQELESAELRVLLHPDPDRNLSPFFVRDLACRPRYEGQWTSRFDDEARRRARSTLFVDVPDAEVSSFAAHAFALPEGWADVGLGGLPEQQWMLHLPGRFIHGNGVIDACGSVGPAPAHSDAEVRLDVHLDLYNEMLTAAGFGAPAEWTLFGLEAVDRLTWSACFVDGLIHDVVQLDVDGPLGGVGSFFTERDRPLPAQGLPEGGMVQLRAALDLRETYDGLVAADDDFALPGPLVDGLLAALDGGVALACCAPAPGGLIPRLYLTLGLEDAAALDQAISSALPPELEVKKVRYGDVEVSVLKIPGAPSGLQPAWCVVDEKLHVAESAQSMRALLKAQGSDAVAMDVGEMTAPPGDGTALTSFDLRYDPAAIYEAFYEIWLPLFERSGFNELPPPVTRDDLPEPDVVARHLGKGRGVIRRTEDSVALVQSSASGGLELTALLFAYPTMLAPLMSDFMEDEVHLAVARSKLQAVHDALEDFEGREGRRPRDLAELCTAQQLSADALLLPGDELAEQIELPGGRTVRSSFRYYPAGVKVPRGRGSAFIGVVGGPVQNGLAAKTPALLIELRPHQFHRAMLLENGEVPDTYGDFGTTLPIDQFPAGDEKKR